MPNYWENLVSSELEVDAASTDLTAELLKESGEKLGRAAISSRVPGIFSGTPIIEAFQSVLAKTQVSFHPLVEEGQELEPGKTFLEIQGSVGQILSLERTLLNFLGISCGTATLTRKFVDAIGGLPVTLLATRKTLPGLRALQLTAVQAGGGRVHRRSLADGILIKDNHTALLDEKTLLERAHQSRSPLIGVEIEVQNWESLHRVFESPAPHVIMLDNFSLKDLKVAVLEVRAKYGKSVAIEASGGVDLGSVRSIAECGVDFISVGAITHSAPTLNLTLDFLPS